MPECHRPSVLLSKAERVECVFEVQRDELGVVVVEVGSLKCFRSGRKSTTLCVLCIDDVSLDAAAKEVDAEPALAGLIWFRFDQECSLFHRCGRLLTPPSASAQKLLQFGYFSARH